MSKQEWERTQAIIEKVLEIGEIGKNEQKKTN